MDQQLIQRLNPEQQAEILALSDKLNDLREQEAARDSFMGYVRYIWPGFIEGSHHRLMGEAFDRIIDGSNKRLIINLGPRHTKSEFASRLLPSFYLGHYPDHKIIQASHTSDFATAFGRRVRNLVATDKYKKLFPDTTLVADSKAAGRWSTSAEGEYFAIGVGGAVSGHGANLLIVDDPHTEQDYVQALRGDTDVFDKVYEWYTAGPRQRLQPGGSLVLVMTRWHMRDLTGRLVNSMVSGRGDQWEIIEFPAILPDTDESLWPEYWPYQELANTRKTLSVSQWNAQYLQNPTAEEGALVKREWWKTWVQPEPPVCEFIIQSWDTAFLKTQRADYSACTSWGVFNLPDEEGIDRANVILLGAYKERLEFPDLKRKALELYKKRKPDAFIVEAKAAGLPLIFELRAMGIPVEEYCPSRGNDKVVRVNAVSDLFRSGLVWCPDTRWADEVKEEFAGFPMAAHDDYVDSSTQALLRFRRGGFLPLDSDEQDEPFYGRRFSPY